MEPSTNGAEATNMISPEIREEKNVVSGEQEAIPDAINPVEGYGNVIEENEGAQQVHDGGDAADEAGGLDGHNQETAPEQENEEVIQEKQPSPSSAKKRFNAWFTTIRGKYRKSGDNSAQQQNQEQGEGVCEVEGVAVTSVGDAQDSTVKILYLDRSPTPGSDGLDSDERRVLHEQAMNSQEHNIEEPQPKNQKQSPLNRVSTSRAAIAVSKGSKRAASEAKKHLSRAGTSIKEASKRAESAGVAIASAWNRTLDASMWVSITCGLLAILFLAVAVSTMQWRVQTYKYEDSNGRNISTVNMGLVDVQRVQHLDRAEDAGDIWIYDTPYTYDNLINSAYCITPSSRTTSSSARRLQDVSSSTVPSGPLANPPPHSITLGRDPSVAGSLSGSVAGIREQLLGPTIYDINCMNIESMKKGGKVMLNLSIGVFVFASIAVLTGGAVTFGGIGSTHRKPWIKSLPLNIVGTLSWFLSSILHLSALSAWGAHTDVAACATSGGGAAVCGLGVSSILAIVALVFNILATLAYTVFFTHTYIRDLGLQWKEEKERREQSYPEQIHQNDEIQINEVSDEIINKRSYNNNTSRQSSKNSTNTQPTQRLQHQQQQQSQEEQQQQSQQQQEQQQQSQHQQEQQQQEGIEMIDIEANGGIGTASRDNNDMAEVILAATEV